MNIELLIDDKKSNIYNLSNLIKQVTWKTKRKGSPSSLEATLLTDETLGISNGDIIRFKVDGVNIFYGYVFKHSGNEGEEIKLTAYDQIKYLMYNDTFLDVNLKASEVVERILYNLGLTKGIIEDTGYVIPRVNEKDKKLVDIIYKALEETLGLTKRTFVLYDDFGSINLKDINNMRQELIISENTNLGKYDWSKSIEDSYNAIKLVRKREDSEEEEVYTTEDKNNIYKWGKLQFFKSVDDKVNKAKMEEILKAHLILKNKEKKSLKLKDVLGTDIELEAKLRGGSSVWVDIKRYGINEMYLIEEATHKFSKDGHIMDFDLKVV